MSYVLNIRDKSGKFHGIPAIKGEKGDGGGTGQKTSDGGEIFNDCGTNKAVAEFSSAKGSNNIAGCKGYYFQSVDITNKKIYLSKTQVVPIISTNDLTDVSFGDMGFAVSDVITIINDSKYDLCSTITEISSNCITVDKIPFTTINGSIADSREYSVFCSAKPNLNNQYAVQIGTSASAEGVDNIAAGYGSHSEGRQNNSASEYAHTEGRKNVAVYAAHAEGMNCKALGQYSHAEGNNTQAKGTYAHTEGRTTAAEGIAAHSEGLQTQAVGAYSHAEGFKTQAKGDSTHAEGIGTIATRQGSHVVGKFNVEDSEKKYIEIVGNGSDENNRSNARTLDSNGNEVLKGSLKVNGNKAVATQEYVANYVSENASGGGSNIIEELDKKQDKIGSASSSDYNVWLRLPGNPQTSGSKGLYIQDKDSGNRAYFGDDGATIYKVLDMNGQRIRSVGTPMLDNDVTTKKYVDDLFAANITALETLIDESGVL